MGLAQTSFARTQQYSSQPCVDEGFLFLAATKKQQKGITDV
jgi:hypothetical protein